jgi:hypothetical protein
LSANYKLVDSYENAGSAETESIKSYSWSVLIISGILTGLILTAILSLLKELILVTIKDLENTYSVEQTKDLHTVLDEVFVELSSINFEETPICTYALITAISEIVMLIDAASPQEEDPNRVMVLFRQEELRKILQEPNAKYSMQLKEAQEDPRFAALSASTSV